MASPEVTLNFTWTRETASLVARCSACPWFMEDVGSVEDKVVRDQVIVRIARRHVGDCAGQVEEQEKAHAENREAGRDPLATPPDSGV